MSNICIKCNAGISSSDSNAEDFICSSCLVDDLQDQLEAADEIITKVESNYIEDARALISLYNKNFK